jgi:hypothetical protein
MVAFWMPTVIRIYSPPKVDTKQEAALAYDREARQCGKDKSLNYESIKAGEEAAAHAQAEFSRSQTR